MTPEEHRELCWKHSSPEAIVLGALFFWQLALRVAVLGWHESVTVSADDLPEALMDHTLLDMKLVLP